MALDKSRIVSVPSCSLTVETTIMSQKSWSNTLLLFLLSLLK